MFIGHFGLSFAVKAAAPRLSLGALFLATQWPDILWSVLTLLGAERTDIDPRQRTNPFRFRFFPYSHGLPAVLGWAVLAMVATRRLASGTRRQRRRAGLLTGGLVASHWLLDLIVHRSDLPLWDNRWKVGFGLWNIPAAAALAEAGTLLAGMMIYLRTTVPRPTLAGRYGVPIFGALLLGFQMMVNAARPSSVRAGAASGLAGYAALAAAAEWLDRQRTEAPPPSIPM